MTKETINKRIFEIFLCGLLISLCLWTSVSVYGQEENYTVKQQRIFFDVDAKAISRVELDYEIEAQMFQKIDVLVPSNNQKLAAYRVSVQPSQGPAVALTETSSGVAGSFQVQQSAKGAEFSITYPVVEDTFRLKIEYDLFSAVTNYQDIAYFEAEWLPLATIEKEKTSIQLEASIPGEIKADEIDYWIRYGQLVDHALQQREGKTYLWLELNRESQELAPLSLKMLFPKAVTPNNSQKIEIAAKKIISDRESVFQAEQQKKEKEQLLFFRLRLTLGLIVPFVITIIAFRFLKNKYKDIEVKEGFHTNWLQLIEQVASSLVNWQIYQREPGPNDLAASILELGRRGYLKLIPVRKSTRSQSRVRNSYTVAIQLLDANPAYLTSPERYALQLISQEMGAKEMQTLDEIIYSLQSGKKGKKIAQNNWKKYVDAIKVKSCSEGKMQNRSTKYVKIFTWIWLFVSLFIQFILVKNLKISGQSHYLAWIIAVGALHLLLVLALIIFLYRQPKYTKQAVHQMKQWDHFKAALRNSQHSTLIEYKDINDWEQWLIYGVALGETRTIQQSFTHAFDIDDLKTVSQSQNGDFYRVHGSIANILLPNVREWVELLDLKQRWKRKVEGYQ